MKSRHTHADGQLLEQELTRQIIGGFYTTYDGLGYGFLESVYRRSLAHVLTRAGLSVECEALIDVWFDGIHVGHYRTDMLVEGKVVVELKAIERLVPANRKQLMNYLRGSKLEVGLLFNFGPMAQFERVVYSNSRKDFSSSK